MSLFRHEKISDPQLRIEDPSLLAATATAGSATLPANPVGFVLIKVNGVDSKIPYYNV